MWAWGGAPELQAEPLRCDTVALGAQILGTARGVEALTEREDPNRHVALFDSLLLPLLAASLGRGDLLPPGPPSRRCQQVG